MSSDILARFLPRFAVIAAERVERARAHAACGEVGAVAGELHSLAGEASLLDQREIAELARQGERCARGKPQPGELEGVLEALAGHVASLRPVGDAR